MQAPRFPGFDGGPAVRLPLDELDATVDEALAGLGGLPRTFAVRELEARALQCRAAIAAGKSGAFSAWIQCALTVKVLTIETDVLALRERLRRIRRAPVKGVATAPARTKRARRLAV